MKTNHPTKEQAFIENVYSTALDKYSQEMLDEFIDYWTEPNQKGKMRWEGEKFFHIGRRLGRWAKNNRAWNKGKNIDVKAEFLKDRYGIS